MERVDPIRSEKKIQDLKKYLIGAGNIRNYTLIVLGLNSALRISDILSLRWNDVYNFDEDEFKSHVLIREKKTDKLKKNLLNKNALEALTRLQRELGHIKGHEYIFKSREGKNKAITRCMAIKIIRESCKAVGIKDHIGFHSLRKTFGYHSITKLYLGICQYDIDEVYRMVEL